MSEWLSTERMVANWLNQCSPQDPQLHHQIQHTLLLHPDESEQAIKVLFDQANGDVARQMFGGSVLRAAYDEDRHLQETGTDARTGAASLRGLERWLASHYDIGVSERRRRKSPVDRSLGIIAIDLVNFKQINDVLGENFGDCVLRVVANTFKASCRATDLVARVGGDEFIVLLPDISPDGLRAVYTRLQTTEHNKVKSTTYQAAWTAIKSTPDGTREIAPYAEGQSLAEREILINGEVITPLGILALAATGSKHVIITPDRCDEAYREALEAAIRERNTDKTFLHGFAGTYRTFENIVN